MTGRIFIYRRVTIIRVFDMYIYGKINFYACRNTDDFFLEASVSMKWEFMISGDTNLRKYPRFNSHC